jgi:hypothetical protein
VKDINLGIGSATLIMLSDHSDYDCDDQLSVDIEIYRSTTTTIEDDFQRSCAIEHEQMDDDITYEENAQIDRFILDLECISCSDDVDYVMHDHDNNENETRDAYRSSDDDNYPEDELTPAEVLQCITNETDMFSVDHYGDACEVLLAQPQFIVLRQTEWTSLVLFPDGAHAIFITADVETVQLPRSSSSISESSDFHELAISYCAAALNRQISDEGFVLDSSSPTLVLKDSQLDKEHLDKIYCKLDTAQIICNR